MELSRKINKANFLPQISFSADEFNQVRYFELVGEKFLKESSSEFNKNLKYEESKRLIPSGNNCKIRLIDKRFLRKVNLKPDTIGCVSENRVADYIISDEIKAAFIKAGLRGVDYFPVYHINGKDIHQGYSQIFTREILPPAQLDLAFKILDNNGSVYFNKLGTFSYDYGGINPDADFFRSAEPIYCEHTSAMIVSESVYNCYNAEKLKGVIFKPVLDIDSDLYKHYIEKWSDIFRKVFVNPRNSLLEYTMSVEENDRDDLINKINIAFGLKED
jgi:hypothetical protein